MRGMKFPAKHAVKTLILFILKGSNSSTNIEYLHVLCGKR